MNLNPNDWSCLPTAFANVIEIPVGSHRCGPETPPLPLPQDSSPGGEQAL